ncbi:mitochondrial aspartate-glutamate transporter agc1 [Lobosporangium transversale]|uniref:Mitochondrial aspartate-glutamate transporter AGC1 n=1 Tax=Lobosporangium transversale TaxID=64571 RepID=A0A1Y2GBP9_9FUNG|nr:mitochondrial carrier domain-containing protein [Lobosporangium transversale]KAF9917663.1 mitochondrial aspartate-glutamate transporter agc1 [Lobosporangium transversale]ORZ04599.1 mitochondrial carrier domain-containing protein [Lobosporangium transversale]|eukprot:XP_021876645.1 mitochondrial carrier domain-containing protein [Lobosporangium transversale]
MSQKTAFSSSISNEVAVERYKRVFHRFASIEKNGEKFMTKDDFVNAIAPGEDYKRLQRSQYGVLFNVADQSKSGILSLSDFIVFENLLTRPDAEYEIAFRLFDTKGSGTITREQFKQILSANIGPDAIAFDFDCEWLKLYTGGKSATHEMPYKEFTQVLKGLQAERLRQAFKYYDTQAIGYITPDEFRRIIIDIAGHKLSDHVLDNLPTLANVYAGNKISFANVMAFYNVIREMDMVERIIRKAVSESKDGTITKADFLNTAAKETRFALFTPMEADIIFHFAGLDNTSGKLTLRDFYRLLESKWEHAAAPVAVLAEPEVKHGRIHDLLKGSYGFLLGSISGAVGATVVYPIDLVKTRMQNQRSKVVGELLYKNSIDCFKKVIKNEGVLGLYRGLGPQLVGVAPEKAIKLTMNDLVRKHLTDKDGNITFTSELIAGGVAGGSQVVFTNPLEIVKIRLQVAGEAAKSMDINAPRPGAVQIVRNLGIVGLYKGASACLLRDIPFSAIYFPVYAHLKKDLFKEGPDHRLTIGELLIAGAVAGMPAAYFTTPADVIKTRLQVEAKKGQSTYNGITDAARKIYREEGFRAFFKGGPARIFRSSPQFGTTLMVYEILQRAFPFDGKQPALNKDLAQAAAPGEDLSYLQSKNALKILLDVHYKFGIVPTTNIKLPGAAAAITGTA